jgi:NACalpha-BTF3-like transcription factor
VCFCGVLCCVCLLQANCSRAKAVKALRKHKNIVDAILELTP